MCAILSFNFDLHSDSHFKSVAKLSENEYCGEDHAVVRAVSAVEQDVETGLATGVVRPALIGGGGDGGGGGGGVCVSLAGVVRPALTGGDGVCVCVCVSR